MSDLTEKSGIKEIVEPQETNSVENEDNLPEQNGSKNETEIDFTESLENKTNWTEPKSKGKGKGKGQSNLRQTKFVQKVDSETVIKVNVRESNKIETKPIDKDDSVDSPDDIKDVESDDGDPIDLSNSSAFQTDASVRYSVIVCSKNNKNSKNSSSSRLTEFIVKNVDSAKKVLFNTDTEVPVADKRDASNQVEDVQWNSWRCNKEIDSSNVESPNLINYKCKVGRIGGECNTESQTSDSSLETIRSCRKRLLATPKFTFTKKLCNEDASPTLNTPEEVLDSTEYATSPPELAQWLQMYDVWSNRERNNAINALINKSTIMQVRHMMKTIEPLFQTDFISLLPKELALVILSYLKPEDLSKVAQTCRYWRFLANDNLLWKKLCYRGGITAIRATVFNLPSTSQWKAAYASQHMIENNWRTKSATEAITMRGHDDHVITCLQCYGNKIVSGSDDTTLKVWSTITGECLQTLTGHAGGVWSCQMIDDTVVSGSTDRTLRVWNAVTGKCTSVLGGHTSTVRCMRLYKNKVVSGSRDATLRVWLLPQGRCLQVLTGHLAAVRCVQYDGKLVVSGAYDFCVKVWNPDTGECLHTLRGHTNRVYTLKFDGVHIVSGSLDTTIRVWEATTGQLKHTLVGHTSLITSMELQDNILVSGNADSTLKIWDINSGQCLHTLAGTKKHQLSVTYVQLLKRFVVSSSDDGTVKLWDLKTGEFIRNIVQLASGGAGGNVLRIRATNTQLVCAVGSRNGTEETKLMLMKFDRRISCLTCNEVVDH